MPRLGILGTMVWDSIYGHASEPGPPVEAWGGIAYALAAADAALGPDWTVFPILKVGSDMRESVDEFVAGLSRIGSLEGIQSVPERNNRVELFYHDTSRRCERLSGGVPGWTAEELIPFAQTCDALYVNFIAGWELDLDAASALRAAVGGLVYADLHSLMLGTEDDGRRILRPLEDWETWLDCFDLVQLNEDELITLAGGSPHPWDLPAQVLGGRTRAVLVTIGAQGVRWVADPRRLLAASVDDALGGFGPGHGSHDGSTPEGGLLRGEIEADAVVEDGDPTGCGDVWGATCFAALVSEADLETSMRAANRAAGLNARRSGAEGLAKALRAGAASNDGIASGGRASP